MYALLSINMAIALWVDNLSAFVAWACAVIWCMNYYSIK